MADLPISRKDVLQYLRDRGFIETQIYQLMNVPAAYFGHKTADNYALTLEMDGDPLAWNKVKEIFGRIFGS